LAEAWQSAWVEILPDFKNFKSTANGQMSSTLGAAGTAGGLAAGRNIGTGMLGGIKGIAGPLIAVVAALGIGKLIGDAVSSGISYGLASIDLASDLNESFNAVQVTFGKEIAADLKVLAEAAPETLRVTRKTFNEYATRFSSFGKTIVGEGGDVVKFMDELTTRGADFASVYNVDVGDALQLFQSGLAGETEPLRKYGIDLSAASVAAYAYANGIGTAGKELSESEKIQARYASLLDQTSKVQGDATNTGGDLAAQQRDLAIAFEEAQTKLGENLLPGFLDLVTFANESLIPAFTDMTEKIGPIFGEALEEVAPKVEELVEKLIPLAETILTAAAEDGLPAIVQGMSDFVDGASGFVDGVITVDDSIREMTGGVLGLIDLFKTVPQHTAEVVSGMKIMSDSIFDFALGVGLSLAVATRSFMNFIRDVQRNIGNAGQSFRNAGKALIQNFAKGITAGLVFVAPAIGGVMDFVKGFFPQSPAERGPFSGAGWAAVSASGAAIADEFAGGFNSRAQIDIGSGVSGMFGMSGAAIAPRARQESVPADLTDSTIEKLARTMTSYLRPMTRQG